MVTVALIGWLFILVLMGCQLRTACKRVRFERRQCHGKWYLYVRSRATGRVIGHTRNLWEVLSYGI